MPPVQPNQSNPTYSSMVASGLRDACSGLNTAVGGLGAYVDSARSGWQRAGVPSQAGAQAIYSSHMADLGKLSKGLVVLDGATRLCEVIGSDNPEKAAVEQGLGFGAGLAGGALLGQAGAWAGGGLCLAGGLTAPLAPACAVVGGLGGAVLGSYLGDEAASALVDNYWTEIDGALDGTAVAVGQAWDYTTAFASDAADSVGDFAGSAWESAGDFIGSTYDTYLAGTVN